MRVQNLDEDINVLYKCNVLTYKKFKEDTRMTLKINPVGGKIFCTHPDRHLDPPSRLRDGYRVPFPGEKLLGCGSDHLSPYSVEFKERVERYL